jgi:hypothetical protein
MLPEGLFGNLPMETLPRMEGVQVGGQVNDPQWSGPCIFDILKCTSVVSKISQGFLGTYTAATIEN